MIGIDTNVLVYAHRREASEHGIAARTFAKLAGGATTWAIPWTCIYEFFAVVTNLHDARIVALCLAHGVEVLLTRDQDFSLFPELPAKNPFA